MAPGKGFRYFLVNGQPPVGVRFGVQSQPLRPEALLVRQQGNHCLVCDGDRPLLNFDDRLGDAQRFVQVVQHYHFDRLCSLDTGNGQGMTFLAKSARKSICMVNNDQDRAGGVQSVAFPAEP